jgi:hypothetical protein
MYETDELLSQIETCERAAYWSLDWERARITPNQLLQAGIREGLLSERRDFGQAGGEKIIEIAANRELTTDYPDVYAQVIHTAALADILCHALRKAVDEPWKIPEHVTLPSGRVWRSSSLLSPSGASLRRIILVSNWSRDKHYSFCRAWETIGSVCAYASPMQLAVCVLGHVRDGKRYGYFSRGYRHPINKGLRFRKKNDVSTGFKSTWQAIFREDYDNISTAEWLQGMYTDGVLEDSCFSVTVEVPQESARKHVLDVAARKLDRIEKTTSTPDENYTGCFWPSRCQFIGPCHAGEKEPNGRYGFFPISALM